MHNHNLTNVLASSAACHSYTICYNITIVPLNTNSSNCHLVDEAETDFRELKRVRPREATDGSGVAGTVDVLIVVAGNGLELRETDKLGYRLQAKRKHTGMVVG